MYELSLMFFITVPCCVLGLLATLGLYGDLANFEGFRDKLMGIRGVVLFASVLPTFLVGSWIASLSPSTATVLVAALGFTAAVIAVSTYFEQSILRRSFHLGVPAGTTVGSLVLAYLPILIGSPIAVALAG